MSTARAKRPKSAPSPITQKPPSPAQPMRLMRPMIEAGPAVRLGGDPLPESTRTPLEATFGTDLSPVRVHSDQQSAAAVKSMNARAFAYSNHIFVGSASSPNDVPLMAHETTHVLQQSAGPAVRLSSTESSTAPYEVEANAAAVAAQRGEPFAVREHASSARPQFDEGGGIIGRVMNAIAGMVRSIPGYMLVSFIIGRDIVANRPVERNATNLVGAIMGLVPGGNAMFENLQRSGALQRAFEWFSAEFARLNFTWDYIRGLFTRFTDSLGFSDIFNPGGVIDRLRNLFGEPVRRLREFAGNAVMKVLEFIFEGVMGAGGAQIIAIFRRARATFELIIRDPLRFIGNLIQALAGGFNAFKSNIVRHLQTGLLGWLTGAMGGAGITMPARFDARGILSLVLQILGLTYQNLRARMVRLIGEPRVRLLEGAFEFIRILVTQGLAAAWQKIMEFAGNLVDTVIGGIRDFVVQTIVQQAIVRLISFFNPVGAIIQAILAIYNAVQWFIQRIQQIMQLVNAVVESIANIAAGNLSAAINYVEQSMARALPVIISFLAGLLGLNRIADQIKDVIRRIRAVINGALDRVFEFLAGRIRSFAGPGGDQDPQMRLQRGLADGTAAVNRLSGNRIGLAVMRPVLTAIRLRHRLQVLEPVQRGNRWAVRGVVNPEGEQVTNKEAEVVPAAGGPAAAGAAGAARATGPGANVLEAARAQLTQRLRENQTEEQLTSAVRQIANTLRPGGLTSLELRPVDAREEYEIIGAASPPQVLLRQQFWGRYRRPQVRLVVSISGVRGSDIRQGLQALGSTEQQRTLSYRGAGNVMRNENVTVRDLPLVRQAEQSQAGGVLVASEAVPSTIQVVSWNTGNPSNRDGNASHAERQFTEWWDQQSVDWKARVRRVVFQINYSPCPTCTGFLCEWATLNPRIQAVIRWNNRFWQTTNENVSQMRRCFNSRVTGP